VARVNTDDLLSSWRFIIEPNEAKLWSDKRVIRLRDVSSVYYRRAHAPRPLEKTSAEAWDFVAREARTALRGLYAHLSCPWISHHASITGAENKPLQLKLAREVGFSVPETLITNDPGTAQAFVRAREKTITKAVSYGDLGHGKVLHTSLVPGWSEDMASQISLAPTMLQEYVEKVADWRVTVVDDRVFACRIDSQSNPEYEIDMRRGLHDPTLAHELLPIPVADQLRCVELVRLLRLRFGAIDLAEGVDGALWFLEINPNGQWAWIEDRTGAPISDTLAAALIAYE